MAEECLFCKMASGEMDVSKLYDDPEVFAIRDINPRAPVHFMVIPKRHIPSVAEVQENDGPLLGRMFRVANEVASQEGIAGSGYRFAFNYGRDGGQTIGHLHMHVLGGRRLGAEG
jgi:histidine triad (HIT) family protein